MPHRNRFGREGEAEADALREPRIATRPDLWTAEDYLRYGYRLAARDAALLLAGFLKEQGVALEEADPQLGLDAFNQCRAEAGLPPLNAQEERVFRAVFQTAFSQEMGH